MSKHWLEISVLAALCAGCSPCKDAPGCVIGKELPGGLLSVRAASNDDVWIVGSSADPPDGKGPAVLHYDGKDWRRPDTSTWDGFELWWTWAGPRETVFVGNGGLILEGDAKGGGLVEVDGPTDDITFFGVWGASAADLWAVGQTEHGQGAPALWRRLDGVWSAQKVPNAPGIYFKVHGNKADDAWIVGSAGRSLHWDGVRWSPVPTDTETDTSNAPLLTVDAGGKAPVTVGGFGNGLILEYSGGIWHDVSPDFQPGYNGVCSHGSEAWAVGQNGIRAHREGKKWVTDLDDEVDPATPLDWHSCSVTADGVWMVGGHIASRPIRQGIVAYQGKGRAPADL